MAMDMFLKFSDTKLKGESRDSVHKEEIDVLAWSWGASNSGNTHVGGGSGAGKVNIQDLSFTKWIDKASAPLLLAACNGTHIDNATLVVRKAGGTALEYLTITLKNMIVSSISTGGSGGEDRLTENVTLNFEQVSFSYQEQDEKGGKKGGAATAGWNAATNKQA